MRFWLVCVLLAACATTHPRREITFDPIEIRVDPNDPILKMNAEELFAGGVAAYAAGEFQRAGMYFERLADVFPASQHRRSALYNSGLALAKTGSWGLAAERFKQVRELFPEHKDAHDAHFRLAECYYHLGKLDEAGRVIEEILAGALDDHQRAEAIVKLGVVRFEGGQVELAEDLLRDAMKRYTKLEEEEPVDEDYPAQAQFFLGEVYRAYFSRARIDPAESTDEARLAEDLEHKCELLLSAQGHYLRAVRRGHPEWGTAAGYRIGSLYEELFDELTTAPTPPDMTSDQQELYRRELQKKVKVLITKSIGIYERTLAAAERTQAQNVFVEETQKSLDRMKQLLSEEEERELQEQKEDAASDAAFEEPVHGG